MDNNCATLNTVWHASLEFDSYQKNTPFTKERVMSVESQNACVRWAHERVKLGSEK